MPTAKEFAIRMEDRPGTLGKVLRVLADRGVNILAFQSFPTEGKALTRIVVHRPGELARAASRLGEADININHGYCGVEPGTNVPLLIFGVAEVGRAVTILEQAASAAAAT